MMYLLFNEYGAIKDKQINEWIVQGSNNVNKIGVAIDGVDPTSFALVGVCKLPNGEVITTAPVDEQAEIVDGVYGVVFSLSKDITALEGTLRINIQAINTTTDKVITSYTVFLCVNEGVDPGEILMMTADQYQDLLSKIELDVQQDETILTFSALPNAENYSVGQVIYVRNSSVKKLYECVSNNDTLEWQETFDFNDHYTIARTNDLLLDKQDKLTIESLETAQLQYAVGFDSQGNLRKGAGGGGGGATYTAGTGIDITDFTISIDDTVVETKTHAQDTYATKTSVESIEALIPAQASSSNKLTDKDFVNSSIATETATFRGTYNIVDDLGLTTSATHSEIATAIVTKLASLSIDVTNNDYVFVAYPDATVSTQFTQFDRYKYNASLTSWEWEYTLNNSSFTANQWAAINSGITASMIANFVDLDSAQTITGRKKIIGPLAFNMPDVATNDVTFEVANNSGYFQVDLKRGNNYLLYIDSSFRPNLSITPAYGNNNTLNLGSSSFYWKEGFINKITDQNGSYSSDNVFNVINASDIVDNTLTQAQFDLITNGKPTLIKGTYSVYKDMILFTGGNQDSSYYCKFVAKQGSAQNIIDGLFVIDNTSKQITLTPVYRTNVYNGGLTINKLTEVNSKAIPNYPSDTTKQYKFVQKVGGNLDYVEDVVETITTQSTGGATSIQLKTWVGNQAQYDSIATKDANTQYIII